MSDKEPTPEEIRQAEALARALEGDGSSPDVPEDALQTAALLQSDDLSEERSQAIFEQVVSGTPLEESGGRSSRLRWLVPVGGLAAAMVAGILLVVPGILSDPGPATLPQPEAALLQAQIEAAGPSARDLVALNERMQGYRQNMYQALAERYAE